LTRSHSLIGRKLNESEVVAARCDPTTWLDPVAEAHMITGTAPLAKAVSAGSSRSTNRRVWHAPAFFFDKSKVVRQHTIGSSELMLKRHAQIGAPLRKPQACCHHV
jgi:hypothetical protein